ncbi:TetR/AcrR family transcriptional regulator [Bradyrhizobium sp. 2TAF24]|uniref:TetR/AcrR family transcriptional regulator n=1 Tax=Bradyrhizobium sp. 2TAF24 TaxID=3233011 RepID=UPI003F90138E
MRLFLERGFDATSVEEIAKQAGVAKRFIYARYGDKAELFIAAAEHSFLGSLEDTLHAIKPSHRGVERDLYEFGQKWVTMALQPEAIALHRLFVSSAPQFPDIAKRFVERNRERALGPVEHMFRFYADRGEIELQHPQLMIEQFFISVIGIPQRLALMGIRESAEDEDRRLRMAVRLFVNGCRPSRRDDAG